VLASFAAHGQGSATLNCTAPTKNSNGTNLTNLASYKFYEGTVQGSYSNVVTRPSSDGCNHVFQNLAAGTHYFVATAVSSTGAESVFSNVASKTIQGTPTNPVTVAGPVYTLGITRDSIVMLEVGSVVAGRPCDTNQIVFFSGKIYTRVDVSRVTPFPGQALEAAWAVCL
jgi:hypothetical protein